jgi:hypothetical protein
MKRTDVDRLFRSAVQTAEEAIAEAPFGFETRVVAAWRASKDNGDFADLSRFLRRAGVIACGVLVLAGAAAYRQYRDEATFATVSNEYAIGDSTIQTEFSQ